MRRHTTTRRTVAFVHLTLCGVGLAQVTPQGTATWRWEASIDGGASWQGGLIETLHNPRIVLVRAMVSFETFAHNAYLGGAWLDPYVLTPGPGDDILSSTAPVGSTSRLATTAASPDRFPGLLKLDHVDDHEPPGQGPAWYRAIQQTYQTINEPIWDNPMFLMGFTLLLDGTPGDRRVEAVFRDYFGYPGRPIGVDTIRPYTISMLQAVDQVPVTIRVLPAPGSFALVASAGVWGLARRRRA